MSCVPMTVNLLIHDGENRNFCKHTVYSDVSVFVHFKIFTCSLNGSSLAMRRNLVSKPENMMWDGKQGIVLRKTKGLRKEWAAKSFLQSTFYCGTLGAFISNAREEDKWRRVLGQGSQSFHLYCWRPTVAFYRFRFTVLSVWCLSDW